MYCTVNGKGCCRFCRDDAASPGTLIVAGLARRSAHRSGPHHSSGKDSGQNGDRKLQTNSLARQSKLRGVALHRQQGRAGAARSNVPNARQRLQNKCNTYQPIWLQSVAHTMHLSAARSRQAQAAARDKAGWLEWNVKLDLLCIPCLRLRTLQGYGLPHCASSAR